MANAVFIPLSIAVLTVSDTRTQTNDTSGNLLVERLQNAGHQCIEKAIVADDKYALRAIVSRWIADPQVHAIISTGGTGVTGRDTTPEAITPLLDKELAGFGEVFRSLSWEEIGASTMQSRAIAGVANSTFIFVLPGSSGACRLGWDKLIQPQLDHRTTPCNLAALIPRLNEK